MGPTDERLDDFLVTPPASGSQCFCRWPPVGIGFFQALLGQPAGPLAEGNQGSNLLVRFNELLCMMPEEMTHASLSRQLKALEQRGLVVRTSYNEVPPRVEYSLSEIGRKFDKVLVELEEWGREYIEYMDARRSET